MRGTTIMKRITLYITIITSLFFTIQTLASNAADLVYSGTSIAHLHDIIAYDNAGNTIGGPKTEVESSCNHYFLKKYGSTQLTLTTNYHLNLSNFIMNATASLGGTHHYPLFPLGTAQGVNHFFQFMSDDNTINIYFSIRPRDTAVKAEVGGHVLHNGQPILCTLST